MIRRIYRIVAYTTFAFFLMAVTACKTRKEIPTKPPITAAPVVDRSVPELLSKIEAKKFKSQWMNAKASVVSIQDEKEISFNISLRYKKDSVIWISISPLLGIEVARVMVTPDTVKFMDRLHSKYEVNTFESISKLLQIKVNFETLQSLLIGNLFAYKKNENRFNSVYSEDKYYILSSLNKKKLKRSLEEIDPNKPIIQDIYVDDTTYRINRMRVEDQKINKKLETTYSDFRETPGGLFPYLSVTKVSAEKNLQITIEYTKVNVGEPQEFPFNIPKSYERTR
jgi:hypothetical protein